MRVALKISNDLFHISADIPPFKRPPRRKPFILNSPRVDLNQITLFSEISFKKDASRQRFPITSRNANVSLYKIFYIKYTKNIISLKISYDIFDKRYSRYSKTKKPYILIKKCFLFSYI